MPDLGTAWTTFLQAYAYEQLGNARNVLAVSDRVVRLADSRYLKVLARTALALALRARARLDLGDFRAAIATCDDIIRRFGVWEKPPFGAVIADARLSRMHLSHGDAPRHISTTIQARSATTKTWSIDLT